MQYEKNHSKVVGVSNWNLIEENEINLEKLIYFLKKPSAVETQNNKDKGKERRNPKFFSLLWENWFWRDFYINFGGLKNEMKIFLVLN